MIGPDALPCAIGLKAVRHSKRRGAHGLDGHRQAIHDLSPLRARRVVCEADEPCLRPKSHGGS